jgi:hypothetical protein
MVGQNIKKSESVSAENVVEKKEIPQNIGRNRWRHGMVWQMYPYMEFGIEVFLK